MKVIVATGGTGGHIFPALEVAQELKRNGHDVVIAGAFRQWRERIKEEGFATIELMARGLNRDSVMTLLLSSAIMLRATFDAFRILLKIKPNVVIGFGGYGAFPIVVAAGILRLPTLFHEQNVVPGRANKILAFFVARIAVSFERSQKYFPKNKTILTGCPSHPTASALPAEEIFSKFGLQNDRTTIFVLGGSQGSHRINMEFMGVMNNLRLMRKLQVIHVCGKEDYVALRAQYAEMGVQVSLHEFLKEIHLAYTIADLVIARAGALTVTEIALAQRPAILIPYPHAQNHQKENALVLADAGVAKVLEEKDLAQTSLRQAILAMLEQRPPSNSLAEVCSSMD